MTEEISAVALNILGKDYKVACPKSERNDLLSSASLLEDQMREIQDSGKVIGNERIAVMAALNIIHELSQLKKHNSSNTLDIEKHLTSLRQKIEQALKPG